MYLNYAAQIHGEGISLGSHSQGGAETCVLLSLIPFIVSSACAQRVSGIVELYAMQHRVQLVVSV